MHKTLDQTFADEVREGLGSSPKHLSSKWFYDKRGDQLFVKIMHMPEYYLTDCEHQIFKEQSLDMVAAFGFEDAPFELIELGAGDGTKTLELLKVLDPNQFVYKPIDISEHAVQTLTKRVNDELPDVAVQGVQGEYFQVLRTLQSEAAKVILFMGSNIGNMLDERAGKFLRELGGVMNASDKLLMGIDLKKSKDIVLPAYDDAQGYTKAFNLNILHRINRELGGNFDVAQFKHAPSYDEVTGIAKSHIRSKIDQEVRINALGECYQFSEGEEVFVEVSRKYDDDILEKIIKNSGLKVINRFYDDRQFFCDVLLCKQ